MQKHNDEQLTEKQPSKRTIEWEELPKATAQINRKIQLEEWPTSATEVNKSEKEMFTTVSSYPSAAMLLDINNEMKTNTEAGMERSATAAQMNQCLDSRSAWKRLSMENEMDNEMKTTEAAFLKREADVEEEMRPTAQSVNPQTQYKQSSFLETCPIMTNIAGHPSMQKADSKAWNIICHPLWDKVIRKEGVLLLRNNKTVQEMNGVVSLAQSCPRKAHIAGFPTLPKPTNNEIVEITNMTSFLSLCSEVSQVLGFPSLYNLNDWTANTEPLFQPRVKEKQLSLIGRYDIDKRAIKAMVSLVSSCPTVARCSGFPSHPHPVTMFHVHDIVSLFPLCSQASEIPGFPSVDHHMDIGWECESLLKSPTKKGVIFDTLNCNEMIMNNMVSCVPSCPRVPSIPGFASIPNPQIVHYSLNDVQLFPVCPHDSSIPGFLSLEGHRKKGWITEQDSFLHSPEKNFEFRINDLPRSIDKLNTMLHLVPSCPGASKIPGFPSIPRYSMLNIVPVSPTVSSLPGFSSLKGVSKIQWVFDLHTWCDEHQRETCFVIHNTHQEEDALKAMLALAPSCTEASRIHGFPSKSQTKFRTEPSMVNFIFCCSRASSLQGFSSITIMPSLWTISGAKTICIKPQKTKAEIMMAKGGQDRLYCQNIKGMVTLVTSCPKEARVHGFPSAKTANRPPNMVSLYTTASCVSSVPGFPSARTLSSFCVKRQTKTTHLNLFGERQKESFVLSEEFSGKHKFTTDEMKNMVAMCPHLTRIPSIQSFSKLNPIEGQTTFGETLTSRELPYAQSTHQSLKDTRTPGVSLTSVNNPMTELGETFTALSSKFKFNSCFVLYFT